MTIARDNTELVPGFGMIKGALIDQHFLRRRRHNRFISAVLDTPAHLGVGIDESTALIVHPDGHWSVMGESAASIYDARHAKITPPGAPVLGESGTNIERAAVGQQLLSGHRQGGASAVSGGISSTLGINDDDTRSQARRAPLSRWPLRGANGNLGDRSRSLHRGDRGGAGGAARGGEGHERGES